MNQKETRQKLTKKVFVETEHAFKDWRKWQNH